jgi:glutathione reductase (NADPH)
MQKNLVIYLDVRAKLTDELKKSGIHIRYETEVERVEKLSDDSFRVKFKNNTTTVDTNLVMFAIGRKPTIESLGLDKAGVKTDDKGVIKVDDYSQTNIPNIYAVNFFLILFIYEIFQSFILRSVIVLIVKL